MFPITIIFPFYFMGKAIITFTNDYVLMFAVFISITIMGMLAANMHKPTQETMRIRQKIIGLKLYIEKITAVGPDGRNRNLPPIILKIN